MAVQLLLMGGSAALLFRSFIGEFWPGLLLVEAVPLILACEGWSWFLLARDARRARQ